MHKIVLMRHGESTWNLENRFTGGADVDLTPKCVEEAKFSGRLLNEKGFSFGLACPLVLKRANKTLNAVLEEIDPIRLPIKHYYLAYPETIVAAAAVANQDKVKA